MQKIHDYQNPPLFPGIKDIKQYDILGMKNTQEQQIYEQRKASLKAFWRERPDIIRKHNREKQVKTPKFVSKRNKGI